MLLVFGGIGAWMCMYRLEGGFEREGWEGGGEGIPGEVVVYYVFGAIGMVFPAVIYQYTIVNF